jgi:hypothetical protein
MKPVKTKTIYSTIHPWIGSEAYGDQATQEIDSPRRWLIDSGTGERVGEDKRRHSGSARLDLLLRRCDSDKLPVLVALTMSIITGQGGVAYLGARIWTPGTNLVGVSTYRRWQPGRSLRLAGAGMLRYGEQICWHRNSISRVFTLLAPLYSQPFYSFWHF